MSAILLEDLCFSYPPVLPEGLPVEVLRSLSLAVPSGQALALMGPTSSGKTTLALILAGLAPEMTGGTLRGQAWVDGLDATQTPAAQLSAHLGLVFQEPERQLFNMTVADEVAFGLEGLAMPPAEIAARVTWALERVGLGDPDLLDRAPWQLSGGQQKRLAIATILALRPPILLLDEPMAGLDPLGRREVAAVLRELKQTAGATVVVIDKDAEFVARWAERLVVLADGQIVLDGPPEEVFRQVNRLHDLGVAVPQIAELAARLRAEGEDVAFLTAQAAAGLGPMVRERRRNITTNGKTANGEAEEPIDTVGSIGGNLPVPMEYSSIAPSGLAIDLRDVTFAYEGGTRALDCLSLAIPQGEFTALVGPNGGGKSTLARHLNGLLRPQAGSVAINGRPAAGRPVGDLAREVGYVSQNPDHQIFAPTVREEVAFGPRNLGLKGRRARPSRRRGAGRIRPGSAGRHAARRAGLWTAPAGNSGLGMGHAATYLGVGRANHRIGCALYRPADGLPARAASRRRHDPANYPRPTVSSRGSPARRGDRRRQGGHGRPARRCVWQLASSGHLRPAPAPHYPAVRRHWRPMAFRIRC